MPAADQNTDLLEATTPSLGVQLWLEGNQVCLHVANEGGRGTPELLLLLPVQVDAQGHAQPQLDLAVPRLLSGQTLAAFRNLHLRRLQRTLSTPQTERYSRDEWLQIGRGEPQLLVLMLFRRSRQRQVELGRVEVPALDRHDDWPQICQAVQRLFKQRQTPTWVLRGLVTLPAEDMPPADRAAAAPLLGFTLALSSCQYPAGLLDGTPPSAATRPGPADASLLRLAGLLDNLAEPQRPSLLLLTGDQIYADATAGLFDPRATPPAASRGTQREAEDWLRVPYQNWLASAGVQAVMGRLVSRTMLDDHEIGDNWEPLPEPADPVAQQMLSWRRNAGRQAFQRYLRNLPGGALQPVLWQRCRHRGTRLFIADTRSERGPRRAGADPEAARIMHPEQQQALFAWLAEVPQRPAFVVSPAMLLPRRRLSADAPRGALHSDAWCGYPGSLHALLARLWRLGRQNIVFLSGDEHLSCVVQIQISDAARSRTVSLLSIHSSGLYCPYPFANSRPEDFALPDAWDFHDPCQPGAQFHCSVALQGRWVPGDGFALIGLQPPATAGGDWQLSLQFDRADGVQPGLPQPFVLPSG